VPSLPKKCWNYVKALVGHLADGMAKVSPAEYARRLKTCEACPLRSPDWTCLHPDCGCPLPVKAQWASEPCPLGKWGAGPAGPSPCKGCG
jgi:hypothetical protein